MILKMHAEAVWARVKKFFSRDFKPNALTEEFFQKLMKLKEIGKAPIIIY
jgi:hypothetical protein